MAGRMDQGNAVVGWMDGGSAAVGWLGGGGKCCKDGIDWAGGSRMSLGGRTGWMGRLGCAATGIDLLLEAMI